MRPPDAATDAVSEGVSAVWRAASHAVLARSRAGHLAETGASPVAMDAATTELSDSMNALLIAVRELDAVMNGSGTSRPLNIC
jgi:hypothetical protein